MVYLIVTEQTSLINKEGGEWTIDPRLQKYSVSLELGLGKLLLFQSSENG